MATNPTADQVGGHGAGNRDSQLLNLVFGRVAFKLPKKAFSGLQAAATWGVIGVAAYMAGGWMATTKVDRMTPLEKRIYHRQQLLILQGELKNGINAERNRQSDD